MLKRDLRADSTAHSRMHSSPPSARTGADDLAVAVDRDRHDHLAAPSQR